MRVFLAVWLLFAAALPARTETTASLGGAILGEDSKKAVAGARITLRHAATGDAFATRANKAGQYLFIGLRPGEFYAMRVTAPGYDPEEARGITLSLGEERQLDITLADPAKTTVHLDRMIVVAAREHSQPGAATALTQREIEDRPAIDQTINDYATSDPRITMLDQENSVIAAAGQNVLFNALQIDGIRLDDQFGLSDNGLPAQGNPFSMETIQSVSVDLTSYDAARGGFTGASINAVTKSGDNLFSGSVYHSYRNERFQAADPRTGKRTPFTDETYGFTLGGPVLRNRLFFFVNWERSVHTDPAYETGFEPSDASIARIVSIAKEKYGIDPGVIADPGERSRKSDRHMIKLDWRINARHRLSARYTSSHGGQPNHADYAGASYTSFNSHWYASTRNLDAWSAQLTSKWHDAFQTEAAFAHQRYVSDRTPNARIPQIRVGKVDYDDCHVWFGADATSMVNYLGTEKTQGRINAAWLLGKHRIQFGGEFSRDRFDNRFLDYAWGYYSFSSIDNFEDGVMSGYTLAYTPDGRIPGRAWGYTIVTAFVQDNWRVARGLTITAGLRLDYPMMNDRPAENPKVRETFGRRNDETVDGRHTISPRASFTWTPGRARSFQLRGGIGIFQGRAPGVWMSNSFVNDGMSAVETNEKPAQFVADVDNQPKGEPTPESKLMRVDMMDENLRMPAITRGNIAIDYKLPWQNITATAEWLFSRAEKSLAYRNLNLLQTMTGPDGRALYGHWENESNGDISHITRSQRAHAGFSDVYLLTNAGKDEDDSRASYLTFSLKRPVRKHWGATLSYTRGHATEVSPLKGSSANANFSNRICFNSNSAETGTSNTEVKDRIVASVTARFANSTNKYVTTMQLVYDCHSGRPYSYTFRNDANGDGVTANDLFYVPIGRNDPKLYWRDPAEKEAFFASLATNDALRRFAGQVVPRNSERSSFVHRVDFHFSQQLPLGWRNLRAELVCDILNLGNLLNSNWGCVNQYSSPYNMRMASAYYDESTGMYRYEYPSDPAGQTLQSSNSRWRMQAGIKIKF